jgi:putative Ca2+/H+ antiporter (TMEM165/GDT1 family)
MASFYALGPVFLAVFLAELGDKTQLATMLFASQKDVHPFGVFVASSAALILSSALAVFIGALAARYIEGVPLKLIAGIGFVVIGGWMVVEHLRNAA